MASIDLVPASPCCNFEAPQELAVISKEIEAPQATQELGVTSKEIEAPPCPGNVEVPLESSEGDGNKSFPSKDAPIGKMYHPRNWMLCWDQKIKGSPLLGSFNIICSVVGVGIFGLPYALSNSGWFGLFLLLLTFVMATFTCVIIGDVIQHADGAKSFSELGNLTYGAWGRWLVNISQYITMIGAASIYLVTIASGMKQVFPDIFTDCSSSVAIFGAVVSFHIFFHKLNEVAILSAFNLGVAITITVVVCFEAVVWAVPDAHTVAINSNHDEFTFDILIAFPNIAFAFGCQYILPPIYEELKDKKTYKKMAAVSMIPSLLMYLPVAILGYWAFGDQVQDPIFKNFSGGAINVTIILLVVHLMMSYAIVMNPPELALEEAFVKFLSWRCMAKVQALLHCANRFNRWPLRIVLRLLLTGLTILIAWAIPCFSILLSLVSSLAGTMIYFVFPVLFYLKLVPSIPLWKKLFCYFCLLYSVFGGVGGFYNAVLGVRDCHPSNGGC